MSARGAGLVPVRILNTSGKAQTIAITRNRSSRIAIRTMQVECPIRNPDIACLRVTSYLQ